MEKFAHDLFTKTKNLSQKSEGISRKFKTILYFLSNSTTSAFMRRYSKLESQDIDSTNHLINKNDPYKPGLNLWELLRVLSPYFWLAFLDLWF